MFGDGRSDLAFEVQQDPVAKLEDPHVGDHPSLRGQQRRIAPITGAETEDIVRQEPVKIGLPVRAPKQNPAAAGSTHEPGVLVECAVLVGRNHRRR